MCGLETRQWWHHSFKEASTSQEGAFACVCCKEAPHDTRGVMSGSHTPRHTWELMLHRICSASLPSRCVLLLLWIAVMCISVSLSSLLIRFSSSALCECYCHWQQLGISFLDLTSDFWGKLSSLPEFLLSEHHPEALASSPFSSISALFSPRQPFLIHIFPLTLQIWALFLKLPYCIVTLKRISSSLTPDLVLRFSWPLKKLTLTLSHYTSAIGDCLPDRSGLQTTA